MTDDSAKLLLDLMLEGQAKAKKSSIYPWKIRRVNCELNTISKRTTDLIQAAVQLNKEAHIDERVPRF